MRPATKRKLSFILTVVICVTVVLAAMAWLSGVFRRGAIAPHRVAIAAQPYSGPTHTVTIGSRTSYVELVGSVASETRTTIASRLTANLVELTAIAGRPVKKGDVLARLDDRDIKARVAQATEVLRAAEAARDQAKRDLDRISPLFQQQAASVREYEDARSRFAITSADVARAGQSLNEANVQLSDTVIAAPFDGIVIDRFVEPGDMITAGKPLFEVYDPSRLRLEAIARESDIATLGKLHAEKRPLMVSIPAIQSEREGVIEQVVPAAEPQSRSFIVKVHLADTASLYPGMFARLRVPVSTVQHIEVPAGAVQQVGQIAMVKIVTPAGLTTRAVRLGKTHGENVDILAGLEPGETIALALAE